MAGLFDEVPLDEAERRVPLAEGAVLLRGFLRDRAAELLECIAAVAAAAEFRRMVTPSGLAMSVAMTNCGPRGWVTDRRGYRYETCDPLTDRPWPAFPACFPEAAKSAAAAGGFTNFRPDACLVNRYEPGAKLGLHQDRDELDLTAPIVSFSLGLPATFLFGGSNRRDPVRKYRLEHGDAVVWGGPARLAYHGVAPLADGIHPQTGPVRYNLTFRKTM